MINATYMPSRRLVILLAVAGVLAAIAIAAQLTGHAEVTGDTSADRVASLGRLAGEEPRGAAAAIAAAATTDSDAEVRRAAVIALRKFAAGRRETVESATRDQSPRVRAAAVSTLGGLADAPAARRLDEILKDANEDDSVRVAAAAALAGNDTPEATVLLVQTMEHHPIPKVRDHAVAVLIRKFGLVRVKAHPRAVGECRKADRAEWMDLVETIKMMSETRAAFAKLNQPLHLNWKNLVKRSTVCHPNWKPIKGQ